MLRKPPLTMKYEWYWVYLSFKSLHVFYKTSHLILFPWPNFTFGEPAFSGPSSCYTFNHLLLITFYQLTQLWSVMGFPQFILEVTVAHSTISALIKERHLYTIKMVCVEIDKNCLSHLFLWNIHCSQELICIPCLQDETPSLIFFNKYHESILDCWDLYRGIWQAFQGCQR